MRTQIPEGQGPQHEKVMLNRGERRFLRHVRYGHSVKKIADELDVSVSTVHKYTQLICHQLGLGTRAELQSWAEQHQNAILADEWVDRHFHRPDALPGTPDGDCPCLWCSSLRLGVDRPAQPSEPAV